MLFAIHETHTNPFDLGRICMSFLFIENIMISKH